MVRRAVGALQARRLGRARSVGQRRQLPGSLKGCYAMRSAPCRPAAWAARAARRPAPPAPRVTKGVLRRAVGALQARRLGHVRGVGQRRQLPVSLKGCYAMRSAPCRPAAWAARAARRPAPPAPRVTKGVLRRAVGALQARRLGHVRGVGQRRQLPVSLKGCYAVRSAPCRPAA